MYDVTVISPIPMAIDEPGRTNQSRAISLTRLVFIVTDQNPQRPYTNRDPDDLSEVFFDENFRNLNGVQRCTFSKVIRDHPEVEPAVMTDIRANPTYEYGIGASSLRNRCWITPVLSLIDNFNARRRLEQHSGLLRAQ